MAEGKRKVGKPKRLFTPEEIEEMELMAFAGCQTGTIASNMGIPRPTLESRKDIQLILTKKRAERKLWLRQAQNKQCLTNPAMAIFLGKNELSQSDRKELVPSGNGLISLTVNVTKTYAKNATDEL